MNKKILTVFIVLLIFILAVGCKKKPEKVSSKEELNSGVIKVDVSDEENTSEDNQSDNTSSDSGENEDDSSDSSKDDASSNSGNESNNTSSDDNNKLNNSSSGNTSGSTNGSKPDNSDNKDNNSKPNNSSNNTSSDISKPDNFDNNSKPEDSSKPEDTSKPSDSNNEEDKPDDNAEEYDTISCRPSSDIIWKKVDLVINNIKFNLRLSIPNDWSISNDGSIMRNGNVIGNVLTKSPSSIVKSYEDTNRTQVDNNSIIVKKSIYKSKDSSFRRLFRVSRLGNIGGLKTLYIDVKYSELNSETATKLYEQLKFKEFKTSIPTADSKKTNNILILGSKSISEEYAKITSFLNTMCDTAGETNFKFEIITKSKSTALSSFAGDEQLLNKIKNGEYTYIFQGGFDSIGTSFGNMDDNGYFSKIYNACKDGNTKLVLLPSFDDDMNVVQTVLEKFENTLILNLKGELNSLIEASIGTDKVITSTDIIDSENHFTKHAGFIAAHLIYRNVLGKIPPVINSGELAYTDIQSKFNESYLTTGILSNDKGIVSYILN